MSNGILELVLDSKINNTKEFIEDEMRKAYKLGYDKGYLEAHESTNIIREAYYPERCGSCKAIISDKYSLSDYKYCPHCGKRLIREDKIK